MIGKSGKASPEGKFVRVGKVVLAGQSEEWLLSPRLDGGNFCHECKILCMGRGGRELRHLWSEKGK